MFWIYWNTAKVADVISGHGWVATADRRSHPERRIRRKSTSNEALARCAT